MENGQNQSVVNDLPFNTPINFGNNNVMVISSNFKTAPIQAFYYCLLK
jgi:hypothetical protein